MSNSISPARGFGGPIDLGVAALAALSVGFLTFAMPEDLFSSLIGATHLPDVFAAAAPPLGMKARLAVLGVDAALTFVAVWALLRSLDGKPGAEPKAKAEAKEVDPDAPRLRRADAHPDAPSRRPLFAGADLGEPDDIYEHVYELDTPEPLEAAEPAPSGNGQGFGRRKIAQPEPSHYASEPETPEDAGRKLPRFLDTDEAAPARNPIVPPSQKRGIETLAAQLPDPSEPGAGNSIGSLMHRLERGLSEREEPAPREEAPLPPALASAAEPDGALSPEGVRHRLRSAITDLNQIANRG